MHSILVDSGPLIALFDASDKYHTKTIDFISSNTSRLVTTIASLTEVLHLLDFNRNAQLDFLDWICRGGINLEDITPSDLPRIKKLMETYRDLPMDFADACLVLLAERKKISCIATIDRNFSVYRIHGKKPFKTILL